MVKAATNGIWAPLWDVKLPISNAALWYETYF